MQLKMYFGWRADVRAGREAPAVDTFIRLYAFELINLIGADSPENAFDKLFDLWQCFRDSRCGNDLSEWLRDMAAFYRLSDEYREKIPCVEYDKAVSAMLNCMTVNDDELFEAAAKLGDYKLAESTGLKKAPDDCVESFFGGIQSCNRYCAYFVNSSTRSRSSLNFLRAFATGSGVERSTPPWASASIG